jgi:HK97 family phage prohead protease
MRDIEKRILSAVVELREAVEGAKAAVLTGYAALYNSLSEDLGGFVEVIRPGAFDRALAEKQDVLARAEHDSRMLLGRTSSGTVRLSSDSKGLKYEVDVPDTQAGRDLMALVRRGDVKQSSFAFIVPNREAARVSVAEDGAVLREIFDVDLIDVAPVAMPAYSQTSVSARALEEARAAKPAEQTPEQRKAYALKRFMDERKAEKRAAPLEEQIEAVWCTLYELLGYPWMEDDKGGCWEIEATYPDRVIVEMAPGQYMSYPLTIDAANNVTLGEPTAVEAQYVPVDVPAPAADDQAARGVPNSVNELRLRLSKA